MNEILGRCSKIPKNIKIKDLKIPISNKWISVKEQMPECSKYVLVVDMYENIGVAYSYRYPGKGSIDWFPALVFGEYEWAINPSKITHWMPLPNAPKY